jgi:hypothetical protein
MADYIRSRIPQPPRLVGSVERQSRRGLPLAVGVPVVIDPPRYVTWWWRPRLEPRRHESDSDSSRPETAADADAHDPVVSGENRSDGPLGGGGRDSESPADSDPAPDPDALPDLHLIGVRLVEHGSAELGLGAIYRVEVLNDSTAPVAQSFYVTLAYAGFLSDEGSASQIVDGLPAGARLEIDLVLPVDDRPPRGGAEPPAIFAAVDSRQEVQENDDENNYAEFRRREIAGIDE